MTAAGLASPRLSFPTRRDEAWRYAPLKALAELSFGPAAVADVDSAVDAQIPVFDGPRIVLVNGVVDAGRSDFGTLPAGLIMAPLAGLSDPSVAAHFGAAALDVFAASNVEFGRDGAVIQLAAGVELAEPLHVVDIAVSGADGHASSSGVVIDLGAGSSATVIETRIGSGSDLGGSNVRTTVTLDEGASLEHIVLQDLPAGQMHLGLVAVAQAAGSVLKARSFNLGATYSRLAYDVQLDGAGADAELSGLFFGLGDQTLDQQITIVHDAKDCTSRQTFRGVLDDRSTGIFNGGIDVRPGADGTDAEQSNDNLLLSDKASVNTQPRLEILADEVACKHGATVGQLDETALYYMRTRGIAADEARRLLVAGFARQAIDDIAIEAVRDWIDARLGDNAPGDDHE